MPSGAPNPLLDRFLAAADEAARTRPDVDRDLARELMAEASTVLWDGLVLDGVDPRDHDAVVDGLAEALTAPDPGGALRTGASALGTDALHDPDAARAAYLGAVDVLRL